MPDNTISADGKPLLPDAQTQSSWEWTLLQISLLTIFIFATYRLHKRGVLVPRIVSAWELTKRMAGRSFIRKRSDAGDVNSGGGSSGAAPLAPGEVELVDAESFTNTHMPALVGMSAGDTPLLTPAHIRSLASHLPSRCVGKDWQLLFSTTQHGYNLNTLYSHVKHRGPTLLVAMDDKSYVFGGFASRDWSGNDLVTSSMPYAFAYAAVRAATAPGVNTASYFGSGESFIFSAHPHFAVHRWTRRNSSFLLARGDCLAFGGGGGKFGLYIDSNLEGGSSGTCDTFANPPLASSEMFRVVRVEVWGFVLPAAVRKGGATRAR